MKPLAEACLRNQQPITETLQEILGDAKKSVLEIGSGTGQHAVYIAERLPNVVWQPSDLQKSIKGIEAWRSDSCLKNVLPALCLDMSSEQWPLEQNYDVIFTANTVHFVCWSRVEAMLKNISKYLNAKSLFIVYGPFNRSHQFTSEGNSSLDVWLKERDPESGIKDMDDFIELARKYNLNFSKVFQMPANNLMLVFSN